MNADQTNNPYQNGKKVWQALLNQMEEGRGFLSGMFTSFKNFLKKYFLSFLLFGIIFGGLGIGVFFLKPKTYTAEMTVSYVHYEKKIYADMLGKLNDLIKADQLSGLSSLLDLPEDKVRSIVSVSASNIRREPLLEDLSTDKIPFYIIVKVKDPEILTDLQLALVNYLNGTEFIRERQQYMLEKSKQELAFLEKRLALVDSLSKIIVIKNEGFKENDAITRMELLEETLTIYNRMQEVKGNIAFNKNIEVLDGFIPSGRESEKDWMHWFMYGFLGGVLLRLLLLVFK